MNNSAMVIDTGTVRRASRTFTEAAARSYSMGYESQTGAIPAQRAGQALAPLLVGDDIVTADDPARILVVDGPEGVRSVQEALREYSDLLKVDARHDLRSGLEEARTGMHDVILLALQLPDVWPADAYGRLRQEIQDRPILVIAGSHDAGVAARKVSTPPFCVIERQEADAARLRRLIVSAVLFNRAGGRPQPSAASS